MAERRAVILGLVVLGGALVASAVPAPDRPLVLGLLCFLLAYVYAQLTRPRRDL